MSKNITLEAVASEGAVYTTPALLLFLCKECLPGVAKLGLPTELVEAVDYAAKERANLTNAGTVTQLLVKVGNTMEQLVIAGFGKGKECSPANLRKAAGEAVRTLQELKLEQATVAAPLLLNPARGHYLKALAEGLLLGNYEFTKYQAEAKAATDLGLQVVSSIPEAAAILQEAAIISSAICYTRDLVNEPGNAVTPQIMAEKAMETAKEYGLDCEVLEEKQMAALKMNAILAVGQGSAYPPRMITLKYKGAGDKPYTAFVGKGITFDSGGISIKPDDGMAEMKDDMAGAGAVLGAIRAIAALKLPVNIMAVLACAENMPGSRAQRPGDIVRAANGKTIEVLSTDAEGRMVLADGVWYAGLQGAAKIIDIATLTGAVIIALGEGTSGIVTNEDALAEEIKAAGKRVGEGWWQLPSLPECDEALKSSVADYKNSAGRPGGCITGGLFIGKFVKEGLPWAHLDIGGTSTSHKTKGHIVEGGSGFGAATLIELARSC